jgi:hypothetical protein
MRNKPTDEQTDVMTSAGEPTEVTTNQPTEGSNLVNLVNLGVPEVMKSLQNSAKYGTKERQQPANLSFEVEGKMYSIPVNLGLGFDSEKGQGYFSLESAKGFIATSETFDGESFAQFIKTHLSVERESRNKSGDIIGGLLGLVSKPASTVQRPKTGDGTALNADSKLFFTNIFALLAKSNGVLPVTSTLSYASYDALVKGIEKGEVRIKEKQRFPEPTAIFPGVDVKVWNHYELVLKVTRKAKAKDTTDVIEEVTTETE